MQPLNPNPNFRTCIRVRPNEYPSKMLECTTDSITIRDITGKTTNEKHTFHFNTIWDSNIPQDTIFQYVSEHTVNRLLTGTNSTIIGYGQSGAGKTYTIFGEDDKYSVTPIGFLGEKRDRRGLVPRCIEYLLKKVEELKGSKDVVITCNFLEIYLEQIRDLGKIYYDMKQTSMNASKQGIGSVIFDKELENLEIYEHSNGQMLVKNITTHHINTMNDLYDLLSTGFKIRERLDMKSNAQLWNRAHTIMTFNVIQRDPSNDNLAISNATIQFVDLSGSERIAKSVTEGQQKFQETFQISGSLTSLSKVLGSIASNQKTIPFKECKLTKILYAALNQMSHVVLIANINPHENCFEESYMTLQFVERCKNYVPDLFKEKIQQHHLRGNLPIPGKAQPNEDHANFYMASSNNEKLMRKMADEMSELRNKLDLQTKDMKMKLDRLKEILSLDIDLEKLVNNPNSKEAQAILTQKKALLEHENLKKTIKDYEYQIQILENERKNDAREFQKEQNKLATEIIRVKENMKKELEINKLGFNKLEDNLRKQIAELKSEIFKLQDNNKKLLQEKTSVIFQFNQNLNLKSQELLAKEDQRLYAKKDYESEFKEEADRMKKEYEEIISANEEKHKQFMKQKENEFEDLLTQFKQYRKDKKEQINAMKIEILDLFDIIQKQSKLIEKIDLGIYSGGMRSFNIPQRDKPAMPIRLKFKYLFKYLDEIKIETASTKTLLEKTREEKSEILRDSRKFPTSNSSSFALSRTYNSSASKLVDSITKSQLELTIKKESKDNTQIESTIVKDDKLSTIIEFEDFEVNVNADVKKMLEPDVRVYCEKLKLACKKLKEKLKENIDTVNKYNKLNIYGDINYIISEKEKYEQLYKEELKKNHEQKLCLETQRRALSLNSKSNLTSANNTMTNGFPKLTPQTFTTSITPKSFKHILSTKQRPGTSASTDGIRPYLKQV